MGAVVRAGDAPSAGVSAKGTAFAPSGDVAYAIAGRPLVVAIESAVAVGVAEAVAPDRLPVVAVNGASVTNHSCVLLRPVPASGSGSSWEPEAREWVSEPMGTPDRKGRIVGPGKRADEPGFWSVAIDVPAGNDRAVITLNGRGVPLVWLDPPPPVTGAGRPVRPVASAAAWRDLGERLRPLARDPLQRWRVRLLMDRVSSAELWGEAPPDSFADRVIEAWALRQEECWRCAIEEIRRVDPVLSSDLLHALTAVVALPGGVVVPAWPLDEIGTQRLLRALLDPAEMRSRKVEFARAWLASVPDAVAWVMDDADRAGPTIGVAELSGRRTNVALAFAASPQPAGRSMLAHESVSVRIPLPGPDELGEAPDTALVEVRSENWKGRVSVAAKPVAIKPPGLITGPFFRTLTHATWLAGVAAPATGAAATTAMIQPGTEPGVWQVYLQCAATPEGLQEDRVNIWIGPYSDPAALITVNRMGPSTLLLRGQSTREMPVQIGSLDRGWSALVTIPAETIEADALLRIGFERAVGAERSSWPRPMLPGQVESGRIAVDLSTWGSLAGD